MKFGVGQSVKRTEDIRFVTGQGQYTDDLRFPNETYAAFLRSPQAHAKITSIDISAAKAAPGVVEVLTQDDVDATGAKTMPCMAPIRSRDGTPTKMTAKPLLAKSGVTFVGEAIAMVIAETYAQAKDAVELIAVEFESLDAVGTLAAAPKGPQIWSNAPNNEAFDWADGDEAAVNAAFAAAAHTVAIDVVENRITAMPMETRNAIGLYDAAAGEYTLYTGSQGAGNVRGALTRGVMTNVAEDKVRVITRDVGGGFGMKGFLYPEQPLVLIAAKKSGARCAGAPNALKLFSPTITAATC